MRTLVDMIDNGPRMKHVANSENPCQNWASEDSDGIK